MASMRLITITHLETGRGNCCIINCGRKCHGGYVIDMNMT